MTKYLARDDGGVTETINADTLEQAIEKMRDWMSGADFDTSAGYVYYEASLNLENEDGEYERVHVETMTFRPEEPDCVKGEEHDWQSPHEIVGGIKENPGVFGKGGGVIITECCMLCGCKRVTDTWAQRRDTGEQGLREVTYEAKFYAEEIDKAGIYREAGEYAADAYKEVCEDPIAYGVEHKWQSVDDWIEFEFNGGASDWCRQKVSEYGVTYKTASAILIAAYKQLAELGQLNANLPDEECVEST